MVKEVKKSGKTYYQCEECNFIYLTKNWAQKCEDFCSKYKSCSIEITKHSIKPQ